MKRRMTRRKALAIGAGGAAAATGIGVAVYQSPWMRPLGANSDVRVGVVGLRNKGAEHVKDIDGIRGARITALCDVDQEFLDRESAKLSKKNRTVETYRDIRDMLEKADIDAVVIATPNHWHALAALWAMEAGKDVYLEKPVTHTFAEGEAIVAATRKHKRIVQAGTQYRSEEGMGEAIEWIREGNLGRPQWMHAVSYKRRKPVTRRKSPGIIPATLDYDLWCGPAEKETLYRSRVHYDWHWRWNTGGGDLGNMGVHDLDIARRIMGDPGHPSVIAASGGRFGFGKDAGETPNTQLSAFSFKNPPNFPGVDKMVLTHEMRGLPMKFGMDAMDHFRGVRTGVILQCTDGFLAGSVAYDSKGKKIRKFGDYGGSGHQLNWLKAVTDQGSSILAAPIEQGHLSSALCHLGNISIRIPGKAGGNTSDPGASAAIDLLLGMPPFEEKMKDHLRENAIDFNEEPITQGAILHFDGKKFQHAHANEANALLSRAYRSGFELPSV